MNSKSTFPFLKARKWWEFVSTAFNPCSESRVAVADRITSVFHTDCSEVHLMFFLGIFFFRNLLNSSNILFVFSSIFKGFFFFHLVGGVLPGIPKTTLTSGKAARAVGPSLETNEGVQSGLLF